MSRVYFVRVTSNATHRMIATARHRPQKRKQKPLDNEAGGECLIGECQRRTLLCRAARRVSTICHGINSGVNFFRSISNATTRMIAVASATMTQFSGSGILDGETPIAAIS
jgi:hypothetical protein